MINVIVVIGAGSIGQAIARRISSGKHILLGDLRRENAEAAAKVLSDAGFEVSTAVVDVSSRKSCRRGFSHTGITRHDPESRSVRHRHRT
jgi:saccharopine dehydrogenase-like NADP-dependent oxidoreductase